MRTRFGLLALFALATTASGGAQSPPPPAAALPDRVHHVLALALDPVERTIAVTAEVRPGGAATEVEFLLNARLAITRAEPAAREVPAGDVAWLGDIEGGEPGQGPKVKRYRVALPSPGAPVRLQYGGPFDFGLSDQREE
jgi:hypothetical protein